MTNDLHFRFENGEHVDPTQLARASHKWMVAFGMAMLGDERPLPVRELGDALALGVVNAVTATTVSGGLPTNLYALLGGRNKTGLAPVDPHLLPEVAWCGLARAVYAHELRAIAKRNGARWVLNFAFEFGDARAVDVAEEGEVPVEGAAPHLLLRVTAFDLADNVAVRWWAKAAPTGKDERPVHLLPIDQPVDRNEWGWMDRFGAALANQNVRLGDLIGSVEALRDGGPTLETQVDLRNGAYDDVLVGLRALRSGAAVATLLSEACSDLRVNPGTLLGSVVGWGGEAALLALRPGIDLLADVEEETNDELPMGRGMRA
jgi:hypothetical protein